MKKDEDLQKDVQEAIKWEPLLCTAEIGVSAKDGVVTLTGTVDNYFKKTEAEDAAKKVVGVTALIQDIEVHYGDSWKKNDTELANDILTALKLSWNIPNDSIKIKVESGWVTLEGAMAWNYEKDAAKEAVINLNGVIGVTNNIIIKSYTQDYIEKSELERALARSWALENQKIDIKVNGNRVTLGGTVRSLYQWDEAERIAWKTPGVDAVHNEMLVKDTPLLNM